MERFVKRQLNSSFLQHCYEDLFERKFYYISKNKGSFENVENAVAYIQNATPLGTIIWRIPSVDDFREIYKFSVSFLVADIIETAQRFWTSTQYDVSSSKYFTVQLSDFSRYTDELASLFLIGDPFLIGNQMDIDLKIKEVEFF